MTTLFPLAPRSRLTAIHVGNEQEPILLTDAALHHPQDLVEIAAAAEFAPAYGPGGGYPGERAALPNDYIMSLINVLAGPIGEAFSIGPIRPIRAEGALSIVTLPSERLAPPQRAPHTDSVNPMQFAILHYLCSEAFGGTTFFRHRETGFETLSESNIAQYKKVRAREGHGSDYVDEGAPWFDRTGRITASFNRLVVYRSCLLHSGHVPDVGLLNPDPRRGRLTANIFVTFASM